jgi:membrane protease YdiL (CAAX protease family)
MIHFTKPPVEALAAIVGGIVMGFLAYRTKSVWWGVALHVAVAALMDFLSLGHKGFIW